MASRKRNRSILSSFRKNQPRNASKDARRRHLVETLEQRQLLAGPQLIGIQPNEGSLLVDGSIRDVAPRLLTFRFDEDQQIHASTTDAVRITRAGADDQLGTSDDLMVDLPDGSVVVNPDAGNELLVSFPSALPDDKYRIEVFAFDDPSAGIVGLRNTSSDGSPGELLVTGNLGARKEQVDFELRLGALVEAVVPQPVVREADGSLTQRRDVIVVYFNEDELFVEDDASGDPTLRSAENPRFYQLLNTRETVRTTDDEFFLPTDVQYDPVSHTATLTFADDISNLAMSDDYGPGTIDGGTFRLRIGTAVDDRTELIIQPTTVAIQAAARTDLQTDGAVAVEFRAIEEGEAGNGITVRFERSLTPGVTARVENGREVVFDLGSGVATAEDIRTAALASDVNLLLKVIINGNASAPAGAGLELAPALQMVAAGDTFNSAYDVGVLGGGSQSRTSLILSESIDAQAFLLDQLGGSTDPGHRDLEDSAGLGFVQHYSELFGADTTAGITTIPYHFNPGVTIAGTEMTSRQQTRVREALELWGTNIGVQFTETADQGVSFLMGNISSLTGPNDILQSSLNFAARVDPTFTSSALVLESQRAWQDQYGEDFFRTVMAGIGIVLGLERTPELPASTLLTLAPQFINSSINQNLLNSANDLQTADDRPLEPIFPGNYDVLHGQYLYNLDSQDVDLYRFQVDLDDEDKVGQLSAEIFAERLVDSSLLDSTLTLYQQHQAKALTDFGAGVDLSVEFEAIAPGKLGNSTQVQFVAVNRAFGDSSVDVIPTGVNSFRVEFPRQNTASNLPAVPVQDLLDAINNDPFASSLLTATLVKGDATTDIGAFNQSAFTVNLTGGDVVELSRNDDYFSEDSLIRADLGSGVYYIGVAASGNDHYDPTISGSGFGGSSQGKYDLQLVFEAQVDEVDVLRDLDSDRDLVPGVRIDGDGDGTPGGAFNYWFQSRPLQRQLEFTVDGSGIANGSTIRILGGNGAERTFQFVLQGTTGDNRYIPISYSLADSAESLSQRVAQTLVQNQLATGVTSTYSGSVVTLFNEREIDLSGNFNGATVHGKTIFVDKLAGPSADGTLANPFNNISDPNVANAFGATEAGDIVRIVGNGGNDQSLATEADNFAYEFGLPESGGGVLEDGLAMVVPRDVTTMIDAGAVFRFRNSYVSVGSTDLLVDRSSGALQVLGTPRLLDSTGAVIGDDGDVIFTSTRDRTAGQSVPSNAPAPSNGNWGGLVFRADFDDASGRLNLEDEGIFLQWVNHADIRYGGGANVNINGFQSSVSPIEIVNMRPTITFNEITNSSGAAMSAAPNSFEETSYQAPRFQQEGTFTSDYDRVGPDIHSNVLVDNSLNGLFIKIDTVAGRDTGDLSLAGRLDDIDVVHILSENLLLRGTPGGPLTDGISPDVTNVSGAATVGGTLSDGEYAYRVTFVDANGFESLASVETTSVVVAGTNNAIALATLPTVAEGYRTRRIYRAEVTGAGPFVYSLIEEIDGTSTTFFDDGSTTDGVLDDTRTGTRARLDASLVFDPGLVMKLAGSRIELGQGTQVLAEGLPGQEVVFTSISDDRYGTGGTSDTNNNGSPVNDAQPGNWGGIYVGPNAHLSLDNAVVAFGGGLTSIGGTTKAFNAIELQQGTGRITETTFEQNADGQGGQGPTGRFGRLANTPATIFVRGSQPTIVGNTFISNGGSVIDIDANSFIADLVSDTGRQTGTSDRYSELNNNSGPLVRYNRLDDNGINGMEIRGETLTTASIWDDTDIVHVVYDTIRVGNMHSEGGLLLRSHPDESLVVKFQGAASPYNAEPGTGLTAFGTATDINDRIGGTLQIIGQPGFPVVLTSLADDTIGAGVKPDGTPQTDTNNDDLGSRAESNDWRGILLDEFSNDRNVETVLELELATVESVGTNGSPNSAQVLGDLAPDFYSGDENLRLGFSVHGYLANPGDVDVYSFTGEAGTAVWIDVDQTAFALDTVIELLDSSGNLLARSDNSTGEVFDPSGILTASSLVDGRVGSLASGITEFQDLGSKGQYNDYGTTNVRDAGFRVTLPGASGSRSAYSFRIRSASVNPDDTFAGTTEGAYSVQVRLREDQEFGGSVVRYADIRYANNAIHMRGLMLDSPLLGDAQENEESGGSRNSNDSITVGLDSTAERPQYIGNLLNTDDVSLSVGGSLSNSSDVDFYKFYADFTNLPNETSPQQYFSTVFDVDYADGLSRPDTSLAVFWDPDGEIDSVFNRERAQLILWSEDGNIGEDQSISQSTESADLFDRGSFGTADPFIGPVSIPTSGVYYVAVLSDGQTPSEFTTNPELRREPLPSVARIADDQLEVTGAHTAEAPAIPVLIPRDTLPANWTIDSRRSENGGHGDSDLFDNTTTDNAPGIRVINEIEGNGPARTAAQNLDANPLWNLRYSGDVGDTFSNTSVTIPWIKVAATGNGTIDGYRFTMDNPGQIIIDVDEVSNGFTQDEEDDPVLPADLRLVLLDAAGTVVASNSGVSQNIGQGGSDSSRDPFISIDVPAGTYTFAVGLTDLAYNGTTGQFTGAGLPDNLLYSINVSAEGHAFQGGALGNESLHYTPTSAGSSTFETNAFNLGGYSAADEPFLYFNYYKDGFNPTDLQVFADTDSGSTELSFNFQNAYQNSQFRQARISLDSVVGQDNIRLRFVATSTTGSAGNTTPHLSMDDFVIGFAERGERIANASPGQTDFNFVGSTSSVLSGEYQLEIRQGADYSSSSTSGFTSVHTLDRTFDTNARLVANATSLLAPEGRILQDGDFFELGDGATTVRFEFNDSGSVSLGSIPVPFTTADADYEIAQAIRQAINNSSVQANFKVSAIPQDNSSRDNRIELVGPVQGDFNTVDIEAVDVTSTGTAAELAESLAGPGITLNGNDQYSGSGTGLFSGGEYTLGIDSGVVISTGGIGGVNGPNISGQRSTTATGVGDADLDAAAAITTVDSSSLEFEFVYDGTTALPLNMQVVFASEEYRNDAGANPVDQIAILLTDLSSTITYNLAVKGGNPIDSANYPVGSAQYTDNSPSDGGQFLREFGFDGFTQVLNLSSAETDLGPVALVPSRAYSIKFVIGDQTTNTLDSALFIAAGSLSTDTPADANRLADPNTGRIIFPAILENEIGDRNVERVQSQILIDSNTISNSHVYGVWSEPAIRKTDPIDTIYSSNPFEADGDVPLANIGYNNYIEDPRLGNSGMGAVRNLPTLNNSVQGGLAPGAYIVNNIIEYSQLSGIHIQGESVPLVINPYSFITDPDSDVVTGTSHTNHHYGDNINDGDTFSIDVGRTRVVFEFEDIQSGVGAGGDGVRDGNIPVYYRTDHSAAKNRRSYGYNKHELLLSIRDAILSSPLVQNDMVQLVVPIIGNNVLTSDPSDLAAGNRFNNIQTTFQEPALYLYGASNVWYDTDLPWDVNTVGIHDGVQPFARIVNNTIIGSDGTLSSASGDATDEPNDTIREAVPTQLGISHTPDVFTTAGMLGDSTRVSALQDVDFFSVQLDVGDRLLVDIDTDGSVDSSIRLFNSSGQVVTFYDSAGNPQTLAANAAAPGETAGVDPYMDYTATEKDTYYIAVSGAGNDSFDALSLGNRVDSAQTGAYDLSIEVRAPRQFLIDAEPASAYSSGDSFVIYQVTDLPPARQTAGLPANALRFEFVLGTGGATAGSIPINYAADYTAADMALAIGGAIQGFDSNNPPLPNNQLVDLPDGRSGPIARVTAEVLGGIAGDDEFLDNMTFRPHHAGSNSTTPLGFYDSIEGFGFDDVDTGRTSITSSGAGETEHYVLVKRASNIDANGAIRMDPRPDKNNDQLIPESGVTAVSGASPTLVNNVIINTHGAVIREESRDRGFGDISRGSVSMVKTGEVIVSSNIFMATEEEIALYRTIPRTSSSTFYDIGIEVGPINTNNATDDFNLVIPADGELLQDPFASKYLPVTGSLAVDSAINSLNERAAFAALKQSLGMSVSPILAPARDNTGQLRADDPETQSLPGLGANVFKDRGALDLADFVGPVALANFPQDNDAAGIDTDPTVSFLQLSDGTYGEFRIQLIDTGDTSDPFPGSGIDDDTVVGAVIEGLRKEGATVTLFENGRLLQEGIDYTFSYDSTKNQIRLTPLAGVWRQDRSYRISLNNEDRFVVIAPPAASVSDGDQITITDQNGGLISLEFESGYEIQFPEVLALIVPVAGTGTGGIADADRFTIDDGTNPPVTFEFDLANENNILPGNIRVPFVQGATPAELAQAIATAVTGQAGLDISVQLAGSQVIIGAESGASIDAFDSGLLQASATLAIQPPEAGAGPGGVQDGETFTIDDGLQQVIFEFDSGNGVAANRVRVPVSGANNDVLVSQAIQTAIATTTLNVTPTLIGGQLLLGLPVNGTATAGSGQTRIVGLARTPQDGTTLTLTPNDGSDPVVFELNRTDLVGADGVATGSIAIDFTRLTTGEELAEQIAQAIAAQDQANDIVGLDGTAVVAVGNGVVSVGGEAGLGLTTAGSTSVVISGTPGVTGPSKLQVFGPLQLKVPPFGGATVADHSQFTIINDGVSVLFEYTQTGVLVSPLAQPILYSAGDAPNTLADSTAAAINATALGINAVSIGNDTGIVDLGPIQSDQVDTLTSPLELLRGTVQDGDRISITQNGVTLVFEFEAAIGGGGVSQAGATPVVFAAGASPEEVAAVLASAIRNNQGTLRLTPVADGDSVELNDVPGTIIDTSQAATMVLSGVPGGAAPVSINRGFSAVEVKNALIDAINGINPENEAPFTDLVAIDRGGDTLFVENAQSIGSQVDNYFLQSIADQSDRNLKPNRSDNTTQFTILMPEISLDYGDAPDPVNGVRGRYPTLFDVNGARHVIGDGPVLGRLIDGESDGQPTSAANGDDNAIEVVGSTGTSFVVVQTPGQLAITVPAGVDGDTITIDTGVARATFEFDTDGRFDEDNYAVSLQAGETMGEALERAFNESPLRPADLQIPTASPESLLVIVDDEDGVNFSSEDNPAGVFNRSPGFSTPIDVSVTGAGIVDAWIDFNGDGDWSDPGEKIIGRDIDSDMATFAERITIVNGVPVVQTVTKTFNIVMPATTAAPLAPLQTYARFRISTEGNLNPNGLAVSGEVEDYLVRVLPGQPPTVNASNSQLEYNLQEDNLLQVFDIDGTGTPSVTNDNGVLVGITDPDFDPVAVYSDDVGPRRIVNETGEGGILTMEADGRFSFLPDAEFNGELQFTVRVTDVRPSGQEADQLVSPTAITVTLNVASVNDAPVPTAPGAVIVDADLNEDQVEQFTIEALTDGLFVPGPANELAQELVIKTVGWNVAGTFVPFATEQGGSLQILADGSVQYTPPADFNSTALGTNPDRFIYTVADVPTGAGEASQTSAVPGTVVINLAPVNDPPIAGNDRFDVAEDQPTGSRLPLTGAGSILSNDSGGPADEDQTINLITSDFATPKTTLRGGTVTYVPASGTEDAYLLYQPADNFSGVDQFEYRITDSDGATSTGIVVIDVNGENDPAQFVGINGVAGNDELNFTESKATEQQFTYDLGTWFLDPEGDPLIYTVTTNNSDVVQVQQSGNDLSQLLLTLPSYGFGNAELTVTATDANDPNVTSTVIIPVAVADTPDPPQVLTTLDPLSGLEDQTVVADLSTIFADPDRTQLNYRVISPASFANSPLVSGITFNGDQMQIMLRPDASGSIPITIGASDGTFEVTDSFTLTIGAVPDAPTGVNDTYAVSVGGTLSVLDPQQGVLANDFDPDGNDFTLVLQSDTTEGTLTLNTADGTFVYVNEDGAPGGTDSFTYVLQDSTGTSAPVTVTLNLTQSAYQNPLSGMRADVNADGFITPIDALKVINLLNRRNTNSIPVGSIQTGPPDFVDVNGDGRVEPQDALVVITALNRQSRAPQGESLAQGESVAQGESAAGWMTTTAYAAVDTTNLPQTNTIRSSETSDTDTAGASEAGEADVRQAGWQSGYQAIDNRVDQAVDTLLSGMDSDDSGNSRESATDKALSEWFSEISVENL
ncbi:hypothetical protein FF011L_12630 [Roseimaritima multifibrata]|uniref:Dockerin type I repeat protein n=1 Tax=Roseimaritima multifibrata TaxID=1930274 RepID=A0A517MCF3_9BACT|nr:tandem-95 repeat protein [Roseimaritima multifibrata]QDS92516.1 hypothetical protein FF011L_12630 [Roseimaritima multifibrata]